MYVSASAHSDKTNKHLDVAGRDSCLFDKNLTSSGVGCKENPSDSISGKDDTASPNLPVVISSDPGMLVSGRMLWKII